MGRRGNKRSVPGESFVKHLEGGKFRLLNEQLYTSSSSSSLEMFKKEPDLFNLYHRGYREQVSKWPENPLDIIIARLQQLPAGRIVADMGCGEARLAKEVGSTHKVHSFDLGDGGNKNITICDIRNVPLVSATADVVVFCLSLMGTNAEDFIGEASRVLKPGGMLLIAEVRSRVEGDAQEGADGSALLDSASGAASAASGKPARGAAGISQKLRAFLDNVSQIGGGMKLVRIQTRNTMFFVAEFKKPGGKKRSRSKAKAMSAAATGAGAAVGQVVASSQQITGGSPSAVPSAGKGQHGARGVDDASAPGAVVAKKKRRRRAKKSGSPPAAANSSTSSSSSSLSTISQSASATTGAAVAPSNSASTTKAGPAEKQGSVASGAGASEQLASDSGGQEKKGKKKRSRKRKRRGAGQGGGEAQGEGNEIGAGTQGKAHGSGDGAVQRVAKEEQGTAPSPAKKPRLGLAPCIYKRR